MDPQKMKVSELKAALDERGLSTKGKKAVLLERLTAAIAEAEGGAAAAAAGGKGADEESTPASADAADADGSQGKRKREATTPEPSAPAAEQETKRAHVVEAAAAAASPAQPAQPEATPAAEDGEGGGPDAAETAAAAAAEEGEGAGGSAGGMEVDGTTENVDEEAAFDDVDNYKEVEPDYYADRSHNCPYLDTINRVLLDFDFEKLCSVTMSNHNVYACLICGKYFQGRGTGTQANTHSLECDHHVFLNLRTEKFYCLPDNYEIIDPSLEDITYYLKPTFDNVGMKAIEDGTVKSRQNDYVNVSLQVLCRVTPFRNFFLDEKNTEGITDPLVLTFGELIRKMCNPRNFKNHVSPHEFLQAVITASSQKFGMLKQSDPFDFMRWLLDAIHRKLRKKKKNIVTKLFRGAVSVTTRKLPPTESQQELSGITVDPDDAEYDETSKDSPFMILPLDVPPPPLFADSLEKNIIPQVPLFELLNKFDGATEKEYKTHKDLFVKKFRLKALPPFLIVHITRFTTNQFFTEKNPTIVNFPIKNLVFRDYIDVEEGDTDLYRYNLIANVVHEGLPESGKGTYHAHLYHATDESGADQWFSNQDLHVDEMLPQMIPLSTSPDYIAAASFAGSKVGYAFKAGPSGVGYYKDV
eukprot:gene1036-18917_t